MFLFSPSLRLRCGGLTLLEMSIALAIALALAGVAIPAVGGWIAERNFRVELDGLSMRVMEVRRETENAGESRVIWFGEPEDLPENAILENPTLINPGGGFTLERQGRDGRWQTARGTALRIQAGGIVSPAVFRLEREGNYVVFRFDPLTGLLEEQEFSFTQ